MDKIKRLKELTDLLHKASYAYYGKDEPIMSDKEYDDLCDELIQLEYATGITLSGSPTQVVQGYVLDGFKKVKHSKPMLSANKTKDIEKIKRFIGKRQCIVSWKEDGLTVVLRYKNGTFTQAITRGQGDIGEDITHTMMTCGNIPMKIPYCVDIEVRGECVISWNEFNRINSTLTSPYKHPRNLAAGSVRQLDANITKQRNIVFKAFELVQDDLYQKSKTDTYLREQVMNISESFDFLNECGFDVVEYECITNDNVEEVIKKYIPENYEFPVDGLIFEYNDYIYGKELGETAHYPLNMIALKWKDDLYETTLKDIEWNTSRTGLINPVATFEPVDLDGAITTRATLHNISYIEDLQLGIGDTITIYRSNMVIPKVHDNLTRSNTWRLPDRCPCCGGKVEIHNENNSKTLHCTNPGCKAKLLGKLVHFCSKNAVNVDGMSEATLQFLIDRGWINSFKDIYRLDHYKMSWKEYDGFGDKSVDKLLDAIEKSRNIILSNFLYSLSIPLIGKSASRDIAKECNNSIEKFIDRMNSNNENTSFINIPGFGLEMCKSLSMWWDENKFMVYELMKEFTFKETGSSDIHSVISGKNFVITGSLNHYNNRDELVRDIYKLGGKVIGSVSSKTDFLINNDTQSKSSKNQKAKKLNVPIISEEEFIKMIS